MADVMFIYVTHPDAGQAATLGTALVEQKLAACVNMFAGMQSIYRWQGAIESGSETSMIVKTTASLFEPARAFIRAHHPYECPCIVALPVTAGDPEYLSWIEACCRQEG